MDRNDSLYKKSPLHLKKAWLMKNKCLMDIKIKPAIFLWSIPLYVVLNRALSEKRGVLFLFRNNNKDREEYQTFTI